MGWRRERRAIRMLHALMAIYLAASGIEMLDRSGVAADHTVVNDVAEALRDVRTAGAPTGLTDEIERAFEAVRRLADSFEEAGEAIN